MDHFLQISGGEASGMQKVDVRFSLIRKNWVSQKSDMKTWMRTLLRTGGPCESVVSPSTWNWACREGPIEEAGGSSSRQEGIGVAFFVYSEMNNLEVEEELSTIPTLARTEGAWLGRWRNAQLKGLREKVFEVQTWRQVGGICGSNHV